MKPKPRIVAVLGRGALRDVPATGDADIIEVRLDLEAGEVHVLGKGGKRRSVPLGRQAQAALARWRAERWAGGTGSTSYQHKTFISRQSSWGALASPFFGRGSVRTLAASIDP